jgi:hypothetical protein
MGDSRAGRKMATETPARKYERLIALVLVVCVVTVGFWEVMAGRSSRAFQPSGLIAYDLRGFTPESASWSVRFVSVNSDPIEPNIAVYEVRDKRPERHEELPNHSDTHTLTYSDTPVWVRLVHGYNMPDCMRIKGYNVELLDDIRLRQEAAVRQGLQPLAMQAWGAEGKSPVTLPPRNPVTDTPPFPRKIQVWRLTSSTGDMSIWVTGMLKAGGFSETDVDVRSMAFPRIGIPDDPGWLPRGITLKSLRHPIRDFRLLLRTEWNNARCDLATFLKLKQPAWADEELLTLVAASPAFVATSGSRGGDSEENVNRLITARAIEAYGFMLKELQKWRAKSNNAKLAHD